MNEKPTVQRALLSRELKRLRMEHQITQREAAEDLEWSVSKIIRIEHGASQLSKEDLDCLLNVYGVIASRRRNLLYKLYYNASKEQSARSKFILALFAKIFYTLINTRLIAIFMAYRHAHEPVDGNASLATRYQLPVGAVAAF